jgi:quercetin dioxygenase-like cupin family protein
MMTASLYQILEFHENKPAIVELFETSYTKEIRITMKKGQRMRELQTQYPFVLELVEGLLVFIVYGDVLDLRKGALLALESGILHDIEAVEDCIIRLTLTKTKKKKLDVKESSQLGISYNRFGEVREEKKNTSSYHLHTNNLLRSF